MARLLTSGFEAQDPTTAGVTATANGCSFPSGRDGGSALQVVTGGTLGTFYGVSTAFTGVSARAYYLRAYIKFSAAPAVSVPIMAIGQGQSSEDTTNAVSIKLTTSRTLELRANANSTVYGTSAVLATDTWHLVELKAQFSTAANDTIEMRVNGTVLGTTTAALTTLAPVALGLGTIGGGAISGFTIQYDDVALNDDQGASQNTYPGAGSVRMLRAVADSAVGTGWVRGDSSAFGGNGWECVNNFPPQGTSDASGTSSNQIRNATAAANSDVRFTLESYTTAGVSGTVKVVEPFTLTGAPSATSPKSGTIGVVSNPAIANTSFGTFHNGAALAATFPSGWAKRKGTTTYAPSVTLATQPVLSVVQSTSSTRIAMVCGVGMMVEFDSAQSIAGGLATATESALAGTVVQSQVVAGGPALLSNTALAGTTILPQVVSGGIATQSNTALAGVVFLQASSVHDTFDGPDHATVWAASETNPVDADFFYDGGRLRIESDSVNFNAATEAVYRIDSYAIEVAGGAPPANAAEIGVFDDAYNKQAGIGFSGSNLYFGVTQGLEGGGFYSTSIAYDATAHRWLRVRRTGGVFYGDTSPDGITWTNRFSTPWAAWLDTTRTRLAMYAEGASANPIYFDNVNVLPQRVDGGVTVEASSALAGAAVPGGVTIAGGVPVATSTALAGTAVVQAPGQSVAGGTAIGSNAALTGSILLATSVPGGIVVSGSAALAGAVVPGLVTIAGGTAIAAHAALAGTVALATAIPGGIGSSTGTALAGSVATTITIAGGTAAATGTALSGTTASSTSVPGGAAISTEVTPQGTVRSAVTIGGSAATSTNTAIAGTVATSTTIPGTTSTITDTALAGSVALSSGPQSIPGGIATSSSTPIAGSTSTSVVVSGGVASSASTTLDGVVRTSFTITSVEPLVTLDAAVGGGVLATNTTGPIVNVRGADGWSGATVRVWSGESWQASSVQVRHADQWQ